MRGALARRRAHIDADVRDVDPGTMTVVTPIADWTGVVRGAREDRTCDRCGVYVPPGRYLWVGAIEQRREDGLRALIMFGLCRHCLDAECVA